MSVVPSDAGLMPPPTLPSYSAGEALPMVSLLSNFARRSQDEVFDLLESLSQSRGSGGLASSAASPPLDESTRRKRLFAFFTGKQRQVGQVFALVRWLMDHHVFLERMRELTAVLDRRTSLLEHTCESMQILQRRVDDRLHPMWDVFTALHVMGSGTYRLLPGIIETRLIEEHQLATHAAGQPNTNPLKPPITQEIITSTTERLNNTLHIKLLSTSLPLDLSHISIRDGMAHLTYGDEFEIGVSLRMGPPPTEPTYPPEPEEARVHWRLYDLKILMNVDQQSALTADLHHNTATPTPLFNDSQLLHLNVLLNTIATGHPNPLSVMCSTMHRLCLVVLMDILHQQSVTLTKLFAMQDVQIEYAQANKILNIKYWRDMKEMPMEGVVSQAATRGATPAAAATTVDTKRKDLLLSPCLQILIDDHDRLSIRHNPPLSSASFPSLFSINFRSISITSLLYNVLMQHGNVRLEQLFLWLQRESREKGRKIVAFMDMEMDYRPTEINTNSNVTVVPRAYLTIRLLPGYTLLVHTDTQSGRFVMEWAHLTSSDGRPSHSNLCAFYGGPSSSLNRLLHGENAKLNQQIASIFEIILHLRMSCLTMQLSTVSSAPSNPRIRVFTQQPPFHAQPVNGLPAAAAVIQSIRHTVFDTVHFKQYSSTPTASNELVRRPGFGPYTVYLQLAGYSMQYFLLIQLNPFAQCNPSCFLIQTEQEVTRPSTSTPTPSKAVSLVTPLHVIRQMIEIKWPIAPPIDASIGFASSLHQSAFGSLVGDVESVVPLLLLRRDLQTNFAFLVREARVVSRITGMHSPVAMPQTMQQIIDRRAKQVKRSRGDQADAPYLLIGLNFPLNYSLHNPAHLTMDTLLDPSNPTLKQDAFALMYATTPGLAPESTGAAPQSTATPAPATAPAGFVVYFYHPLVSKLMAAVRECESTASKSPAWQHVRSLLSSSSSSSPVDVASNWIFDSTGVVTLLYDSVTAGRVARLIYDLDNLYVHMCYLSNYVKQVETAILNSLVSDGGLGMVDEVIEHDGHAMGPAFNLHSAHVKATSLNPTYFPADFFRCVEFNCNQLVFAYVNPSVNDGANPLCHVVITRDSRREVWKMKNITQPHMYPAGGGPVKVPLPGGVDPTEYKVTLLPHAWPQMTFYTIEFNATRPNNILTLLHHVWVAHRTMPPIWNFLQDAQRWQAMGDLTTNHQLMRLCNVPTGSMLHCIAESSTRLRLLFGQQDRTKTQENMWRLKTDLRLIYEGDIVQDFKSGAAIAARPNPAAPQDGPTQTVRPGKIGGDFTQYLHRWYRHLAMEEFKLAIKTAERGVRGDPLLSGARFEIHDSIEVSLATPFIHLQFSPPADATVASFYLSPAEQLAFSAYFAHRIACPPYLSEPIQYFYRLMCASATNASLVLRNLKGLASAFALELIQPHPFPTPFPQRIDANALERIKEITPPDTHTINAYGQTCISPAINTFRFVFRHRTAFDMAFYPDSAMCACTLEVIDAGQIQRFHSSNVSSPSSSSSSSPSSFRPFSLYLPFAFHVIDGSLHRWEVPNRVANGITKKFTPLNLPMHIPNTFASMADAIQIITQTSMEQLADWWSQPNTHAHAHAISHASPHTHTHIHTSHGVSHAHSSHGVGSSLVPLSSSSFDPHPAVSSSGLLLGAAVTDDPQLTLTHQPPVPLTAHTQPTQHTNPFTPTHAKHNNAPYESNNQTHNATNNSATNHYTMTQHGHSFMQQ